MADVDAVVIGAGPNGLVAAALLADAGWRVHVVEAQPEPGGAVRSAELTHPGFVHDVFSAFYPLAAVSPVLRGLRLERHGLRWCHAPVVLAHPTGGRAVTLSRSLPETAASLDAYAEGDGTAWRALADDFASVSDALVDALTSPFPPLRAGARLVAALGPRRLPDFARLALTSVRRLAAERFRGEGGALLLAGNALHTDLGLDQPPGGLLGLLLAGLGQQHGFPAPAGGAGRLTDALVGRARDAGVTIACGDPVVAVEVRDRRAHGVVLAGGTRIGAARAVVADVGAPALYRDLVGEDRLPPAFVRALGGFQYDHATFKVDWALSGPIPWTAEPARRAGTVHVGESMDVLSAYAADLASDRIPARPFLLVGQMNKADPSRSPAGTETVWAYTHVPQHARGDGLGALTGRWDADESERFADRVEAEIEALAPGFRALVTARHLLPPPALEAHDANLVGGAIGGGTMALSQQLVFRPVRGLGRAETPIRGLYLASASAHPGGGVHGACGANAARAALHAARWRRGAGG